MKNNLKRIVCAGLAFGLFLGLAPLKPEAAEKASADAAPKKNIRKTEGEIERTLFESIARLPAIVWGAKDASVRMVMFSRDGCPPCASMKKTLQKTKLPFAVLEVPIAWNADDEEKILKKLGANEQNRKVMLERVRESAALLKDVIGSLAVPTYAWAMPDGTYRMGFIPPSAVRERLKNMVGG